MPARGYYGSFAIMMGVAFSFMFKMVFHQNHKFKAVKKPPRPIDEKRIFVNFLEKA